MKYPAVYQAMGGVLAVVVLVVVVVIVVVYCLKYITVMVWEVGEALRY